jgi:beta propeller repeat protein
MIKPKVIVIFLAALFFFSTIPASAGKPSTDFDLFQITTNGSQQNGPRVHGNKVVWTDWRGTGGLDVWIYDFITKSESPLIVKPNHQRAYGFWRNNVVYRDGSTTPASMRVYNIKTGEDIEVASGDDVVGGAIFANNVLYVDGKAGGDLYVYNLGSRKSKYITGNVYSPSIWGNKIVWTVHLGAGYYAIKGYDLSKQELFDIPTTSNGYQSAPDIYGNTVVWVDSSPGKYGIHGKDLISGKEKVLYESNIYKVGRPAVSNKYVAWVNNRGIGAHDIFVQNRITDEIIELSNFGPQQPSPTAPNIDKDTVVWMSWHTGNGDVYGATLGIK